jgi:hypothetical protein
LVGWLSGFRAKTCSIAKATSVSRLGEAVEPGEGIAGRAPTLHRIPCHLPYNRGKSWKTTFMVAVKCSADQRRTRLFWSTWPSQLILQAKPKLQLGAETCAKRKSTSPCMLPTPAFDRIAWLYNRHLNSNRRIL